MVHSLLVPVQALQAFHPSISEGEGTGDPPIFQGTNLKDGIRGVADVTVTITIGETETMGEMEVGEEEEEGGVVVTLEVETIDHHTGTGGIVMTEDRCLLDDMCGVDEADRGALHRGVPDMEIFHGGTKEPGVLLVWIHADPRRLHNQLP